jgi:hypothetical protein
LGIGAGIEQDQEIAAMPIRTMEHFRAKPGRPSNGIMRSSRQITRSPTTMILAPTGSQASNIPSPTQRGAEMAATFSVVSKPSRAKQT